VKPIKNVLAYLRASTQRQERADTIEIQRTAIAAYCRAQGWKAVLFEDNGVTGECLLEHRPGGKRLLEAAQASRGELVVVYNATRIGRGAVAYVTAIAQIEQHLPIQTVVEGAVLSVTQGGKIATTMLLGGMSAEEKVSIVSRTRAGSHLKAKNPQHWMGGPAPYGYIRVDVLEDTRLEKSAAPTTRDTQLRSEVAVVKRIYRMAAAGDSCRTISDFLNTRGIPAANRKQRAATRWTPGRIGNMLRNTIYKGMHFYARREVYYIPGDPTHTPHTRNTPREKWIERPVPELAIVDDALWQAANDAMRANLSRAKSHAKSAYLLSGAVQCGYCGKRKFTATRIHGDTYYRCAGRSASYSATGKACKSPHLRGDALEGMVWEDIRGLFFRPDETLRRIAEQMDAKGPQRPVAEEVAAVEASLQEREEMRRNYHRQAARGRLSDHDLDSLLREVESEEEALRLQLSVLRMEVTLAQRRAEMLGEAEGILEAMQREVLAGTLPFERRRQIVRALAEVVVWPGGEGKPPEIAVEYRFAGPTERWERRSAKANGVSRWWCRRT
jgi:site-specific DNA recombinase